MRCNATSIYSKSTTGTKISTKQIIGSSFSVFFQLLFILFSSTYCEENSFSMKDGVRNLTQVTDLSSLKSGQIVINGGEKYTRDLRVNLTLKPTSDANEMLVTSSPDCSEGTWEPFKENRTFELKTPNSANSVHVKFRYYGLEETECFTSGIIHDDTPPEISFKNKPDPWISNTSLKLGLEATDPGDYASGVKLIECDKDGNTENPQFETCGVNVVYSSLAENKNYLLVVRAVDRAGNVSSIEQAHWRSDQTEPTVSMSFGPAALTSDTNPQFIFNSNDTGSGVDRLECRVDSNPFSTCQSSFNLGGLSDGSHSLEVRAVDRVGHVSQTVSHSWTQDSTVPTVYLIEKPDPIVNKQAGLFRFSGSDSQSSISYKCELDGGGMQACTSPYNFTGLSDGEHTFSVVAVDGVQNESSPITYRWLVDTTKPTLSLMEKPQPAIGVTKVRFVFSASDVGGSGIKQIHCKLDGGRYEICSNPKMFNNLSEGDHSLIAKSEDRAGNFSTEVSHSWIVDQTKPTVTITSKPKDPINSRVADFSFEGQDNGSGIDRFECRLDGGSFRPCRDSESYTGLADGTHTFSVRARDRVGNTSPSATYSWSVDVTGPAIELTQKPDALTKEKTAHFQFGGVSGGESVSSYKCQLDGGSETACTSPQDFSNLSDGSHTFSVTGLDALGNSSDAIVYTWVVDSINPTLNVTEKPGSLTGSDQARFVFNAQDGGSGVKEIQCKLDSGSYQVCTSPHNLSGLSDSSHTFMAYALDKAGNRSSVFSYSWTVDTTASNIQFTQKPSAVIKEQVARFGFSETGGQNDIRSYECQLDGGSKTACTSPHDLSSLSDGSHTFYVTGLDSLGNRSAVISYTWTVDSTVPTVAFTEKPEAVINTNATRFAFNAQDGSGSGVKEIQCKLDGGSYQVCTSPRILNNLSQGNHSFTIRSKDRAGNFSSEVSHQWSIDLSIPVVTINSKPSDPTKDTSANFTFSASDSGGSIKKTECRLDSGAYETCSSPKAYTNLAEGSHTFSVRAEDRGGNLSAVKSYTWSVDNTPPTITFTTKPDSIVYIGQTAQIRFTGSDSSGIKSYVCTFDGSNYPCTSGTMVSFNAVSTKTNAFQVTATDKAGNQETQTLNWQTKIEAVSKQLDHEVLEKVPVDILFVVDTSGSMDEERRNLATRLDGFIEQIDNDMNWQISATTTDTNKRSNDHSNGRLGDFDPGQGTYILNSSITNAQTLFGNRIQAGGFSRVGGSPREEAGIQAVYQVIGRYNNNESPQTSFFRQGAHLAIVVLSDEPAQGGYTPEQFVRFVNSSFPNKVFAWHSIVNSSGSRYKKLSTLTGGIIGDVSKSNYTNQLKKMGEDVKNMKKEVNLGCIPLDDDLDGNIDMAIEFKASGSQSYSTYSGNSYTITGQRMIFDDYLPTGDFRFSYKCAKK